MWRKDDSGKVEFVCGDCGRVYDMDSEWDRANLDWHEHN